MSFGGYWRRKLFWSDDAKNNGGYIRAQYDQINRALEDANYAYAVQQEKLAEHLAYITKNSPYYASYEGASLSDLPVHNKLQLIEAHDRIAVDPALIPGQTGELHIQRTSGSTGVPFAIPLDTMKRKRRVAELKAFSALDGYYSHEPMGQCRVWTKWQSKTSKQAYREKIYPINVAKLDDETLQTLCNTVKEHRLVALRGYASWFTGLMNFLIEHPENLPKLHTLQVCITHSEALDDATRDYFQSTVGCNMCECYANEENGVLGQQRIGQRVFELNNTGYVFELLALDSNKPVAFGELGRLVITDLHQKAFPMVRYDTGDTAIFSPAAPDSSLPHLKALFGRKLDLVFDSNGKPLHPMSFARILKNIPGIKQWQFAQTNKTAYELRLNATSALDEAGCLAELSDLLGAQAQVAIIHVDDIPVLASGKRRSVVCEWNANS